MAAQVAGGLFNAFAFAGAGFIFSKLDKGNYTKEMKRHNKAIEDLEKARERWNEARLNELDRLSKLREARIEGGKDLESTNKDLIRVKTKFAESKPNLSNFYKPSSEMEEYMTFVKLAATIPVLYGVTTLIL